MNRRSEASVSILGGGLAGSEAAWQLAVRGIKVTLYEMRPGQMPPAHHTGDLAELVCSNSLKSTDPHSAAGSLKHELEAMGSLVLRSARETAVPAGGALAVDRERFSRLITATLESRPEITILREEVTAIPEGLVIVATGPLTSPGLEEALTRLVGSDRLQFFDAAAPIVDADSLDRSVIFAASRYDKGSGADYLNAPMTKAEYERFISALTAAPRVIDKEFHRRELFAACQPIEEVARSGPDAVRYGALKPVGLVDPRTGERPWAVVQLRSESTHHTAYNLVGFQTNLTWTAQREVFSMIPGLQRAEFHRFGVMHRNTFIDAPRRLDPDLSLRDTPRVRFAGQITGTEGYMEAAASGLLAAVNTYASLSALPPLVPPVESALGALIAYSTDPQTTPYQPIHVNWGIVPPLPSRIRGKRERYAAYSARAASRFDAWLRSRPDAGPVQVPDE